MIKLKTLSIKNFMSVGNVMQVVDLTMGDLVLVLGENLDLGGNDNRNGSGKTSILNALSFVLFGEALTKIKKDNLINKTNEKNMLVTLEFEKNGVQYIIERGRRPHVLKFIINGTEFEDKSADESQGENRLTQEHIESTINMTRDMFKHIVALNTYTEPFLSMRAADQRAVIEQLLGMTKLSEKSVKLKELIKLTKDEIKTEEFKIKGKMEANKRIQENIKTIKTKSTIWSKKHKENLSELREQIDLLKNLDVEAELQLHKYKEEVKVLAAAREQKVEKEKRLVSESRKLEKDMEKLAIDYQSAEDAECPTCTQHIHGEILSKVSQEIGAKLEEKSTRVDEISSLLETLRLEIEECVVPPMPDPFYDTIEDAYSHKSTLDALQSQLDKELVATDPYIDQVESLEKTGIQEISYDEINSLTQLKDHQEFLLKLLTNKDSFIRKKIIDQNLSYLNSRLFYYLEKIGLPHEVKFMSDLDVDISQFGKSLDFDNLSRGERTRLILALSWAFRDVYESMNDKINLLFIDENLDNGIDGAGAHCIINILKSMGRDYQRNVFIVSHREELLSKIDTILKATKDGGFSTFSVGL